VFINNQFSVVLSALREKRSTIVAWALGGAMAMYFEALAIAAELKDFPGGPQALAQSIYPTIEGMRIIRWPADRLDTLGGYLAYHNVVLFNFFLGIFAGIQGARLFRHLEEKKRIEMYLATGVSRANLVLLRSFAYLISQIAISLSLGIGTAIAMAASNESNVSGSITTLLAGGICIFPFFGLGLLISQFTTTARNAAGVTALLVTFIYVIDNISGKYSWLDWFRYFSPFYYANQSRPLIPGFGSEFFSWGFMLLIGTLFIAISISLIERRDISSTFATNFNRIKVKKVANKHVPKSLIGDILWRQRYGLLAWIIATSAFIGVFTSMMSGVIDIWRQFSFLEQFTSSGFGATPEEQYLAMVFEVLPPFLAAYIIFQSSKWTVDLLEGRVQLFLSTPMSWSGLVARRAIATFVGAELIVAFSVLVIVIGGRNQNGIINFGGVIRVVVMLTLFILAFIALSSLLVGLLHGKNTTQIVSLYVGAAWLIGFMAPYLKWPEWLVRLSIFDAFGHPYVDWPTRTSLLLIIVMIIPGYVGTFLITERSAKVI
jgi:ABC-2 type transport system permease protein